MRSIFEMRNHCQIGPGFCLMGVDRQNLIQLSFGVWILFGVDQLRDLLQMGGNMIGVGIEDLSHQLLEMFRIRILNRSCESEEQIGVIGNVFECGLKCFLCQSIVVFG